MFRFNPTTGKLDLVNGATIPQYYSDPSSPSSEDVWVKSTIEVGSGGGKLQFLFGLGTPITSPGTRIYQLSYQTKEGTTKRVNLT